MSWAQMRHIILALCFLYVCVGAMAACSKKPLQAGGGAESLPTERVESRDTAQGVDQFGNRGDGIGETSLPGDGIAEPEFGEKVSEGRTSFPLLPVYFDFDSFSILPDMRDRIEDNARFLLDHPQVRIEIQGNCDERGTNEYNLALGEKRAKSTKAYLTNLGVNPERMESMSFGEENPVDPGQSEEAWAKNRRVDFVILK